MIYFIQDSKSRAIKIGISKNPTARLAALQTAHHSTLILLAVMDGNEQDEQALHRMFKHKRGEWFEPTRDLLVFIRENAISTNMPKTYTSYKRRSRTSEQWKPELQSQEFIPSFARLVSYGVADRQWSNADLKEVEKILCDHYEKASERHPQVFPPMSRADVWGEVQRLVSIQTEQPFPTLTPEQGAEWDARRAELALEE